MKHVDATCTYACNNSTHKVVLVPVWNGREVAYLFALQGLQQYQQCPRPALLCIYCSCQCHFVKVAMHSKSSRCTVSNSIDSVCIKNAQIQLLPVEHTSSPCSAVNSAALPASTSAVLLQRPVGFDPFCSGRGCVHSLSFCKCLFVKQYTLPLHPAMPSAQQH